MSLQEQVTKPPVVGTFLAITATWLLGFNVLPIATSPHVALLKASFINGSFSLGLLGYCTVIKQTRSCSIPQLIYQPDVTALTEEYTAQPFFILNGLTGMLVLHFVVFGLAFFTSIAGCLSYNSHFGRRTCAMRFAAFACVPAALALISDWVIWSVAKTALRHRGGFRVEPGPGLWLSLAGTLALVASVPAFYLAYYCRMKREKASRKLPQDGYNVIAGDTKDKSVESIEVMEKFQKSFERRGGRFT